MYKNQLQELAQRSCFNLPSYACIREGPDHAPRFKAKVNFNGEVFGSLSFCSTLRQAEHAAAEVALKTLSMRGPFRALAAKVLDETGVYKNLLQETARRAGLKLPVYTTVRSGSGHVPVFTCTVELGGMSFTGEPARTKKQAQKSVAMTAWFTLKNLSQSGSSSSSSYALSEFGAKDEQEQVIVARYLASLQSVEANKMIQRDCCHELLELAPRRRDVISYQSGRSFYPMQCQSFACSHFLPEMAMYQAQPQERMSEHQSCLLAFPSAPTSVPGPQFFPFVRSIIRPDHGPHFLASWQEQFPLGPRIRPFFYFSDSAMPIPVRSISQVSIKEIDDNTQVEEEWLSIEANSSGWKLNFPSNASGLSPTEVLDYGDSLNTLSRLRIQELLQGEHGKKNSECAPDCRNSSQKDIYRKEEFHWIPPGFIQNRPRARGADEGRFCPQNPNSSSFVCSNARPRNPPMDSSPRLARGFAPPLSAAPVAIRSRNAGAISLGSTRAEAPRPLFSAQTPTSTSVAVGLTRPWVEGAKNIRGMPCASSMAPAVQIRTVVPVCSSPPARKMLGPSQEGIFSRGGRKMTEERGDIPAASSEFSNLNNE